MSDSLFASYLIQGTGALITALIFGGFYREYRRTFLREWALSWSALCVTFAGAALSAVLYDTRPLDDPVRLGLSLVIGAAGYLEVVWLLFGSGDLLGRRPFTPGERRFFLAFAAAAGAALTLVHATDPGGTSIRFLLRAGLRGVIVGIAFLVAAVHVWRAPGVHAIGRRIVVAAFALFGLSQFQLLAIQISGRADALRSSFILSLGFGEFLLMFAMGLGVVIWLLEEQHAAATTNAAQVEQLALHDPLTGLPNRKLFLDHLTIAIPQARRNKHKLAVLFIDLDRFKLVNDSLGHSAGDKLLQVVASRLRSALRETDTVARMGGDEFTVLAPVVHTVEDAIAVARKIRDAIKELITIEGRELFVSGSIGIGIFPDDGADATTVLKNADAAMYRAKAQGPDLFQLYTSEMNAHAIEQLALESALRRGVESLEFLMHYQPIVRTTDGAVAGMEAMLRWKHPVLGLVRPEQFIRLAESTGMIVPIGEWALRTAVRQLADWRAEGFPDLRMAVNLSTRQLQHPDLALCVRNILDECGVPAHALELEINETSATESGLDAVNQLAELKALGVGISIDDFGTGYSSLQSLRTFPVGALKIDTTFTRNLVRDANDTAIAIAVIALARSLGLRVVAEGVEHPTQLDFLHVQQCEYWQGYLCSAPVDAKEATLVLRRMSAAAGRIMSPVSLGAVGAASA
ncbi:MAG: EAL domain-containing protein [Gemmatimonadota bacterium]|nr:EAL domain-containing protein [Gemmatimonadota bacterium]